MKTTSMNRTAFAAIAAVLVSSHSATAQAPAAGETIYACYAPSTGTVYRIKGPGLPNECQGPKSGNNQHVGFSWNEQGVQGAQGVKGDKGDVGATGAAGVKGDVGAVGPIGPQGVAGAVGAVGAAGAVGAQGPKGDKGDAGVAGATGAAGVAGAAGFHGEKGDVGATGATGPIGPRGPEGPKGDRGSNGINGPIGPAGATGTNGFSGYEQVTNFVDLPQRGAFTFDYRNFEVACPVGKVYVGGGALNNDNVSPSEIPPSVMSMWPTLLGNPARHTLIVQLYNPSIIARYTYRITIVCANAS